jgi:hypothetical protein
VGPNPLPVDLANHMPAEASHLVKSVIRECRTAGLELQEVRISPAIAADLQALRPGEPYMHEGVPVVLDSELGTTMQFYRLGSTGADELR